MKTLPVSELLHPLSLACIGLMALNDHYMKASGLLPHWLTGKISDFAGLFFFPLLCTALFNTGVFLLSRLNGGKGLWSRKLYRLTPVKLIVSCGITGICFAAVQLHHGAADAYVHLMGALGFPSQVTMDPTDLVALVVLPVSFYIGMRSRKQSSV